MSVGPSKPFIRCEFVSPLGVKWAGRKADHLFYSLAEVEVQVRMFHTLQGVLTDTGITSFTFTCEISFVIIEKNGRPCVPYRDLKCIILRL
jgi:hypothetical protein